MSATYHHPAVAAPYDGHSIHPYNAAMAQSSHGHLKPVMDDARSSQQYRYPSQQIQEQPNGQYNASNAQASDNLLHQTSGPATPATDTSVATTQSGSVSRRGSDTLIYHSLQLSKCISPKGGNLPDFAAQMTCLFWFESIDELKNAETIRPKTRDALIGNLPALARPHDQFEKWVYNVLSTTQVTQNVIFLALLFIYRLKMSTPQIKGRAGSEYRLLTVALMLGNKFLDDNTYTNKTWAEVSGFAVQEIHVMEVEFLSNMRYNLLASKEEWEQWIVKLSCFHQYYERASKRPTSPFHKVSPTHRVVHSPVLSPTGTGLPPFTSSTTTNLSPSSRQTYNVFAYQTNATSPLASNVSIPLPLSRKRSPDGDLAEHPAKRHVHPTLAGGQVLQPVPGTKLNGHPENTKLPVPHLTVVTNQQYNNRNPYPTQSTGASQQIVSLPPLQPGIRAMSTVYQPSPGAGIAQSQPAGSVTSTTPVSATYSIGAITTQTPIGYGTPTKHHSPGRLGPSYGSSPLVDPFGSGSAVHTPMAHTPISNSPSVYLQNRASPYKPIRHVNRLLYPPSASLDQYHLSVPVQPNQMHYQPLGRRHDLRTGIVPEFLYNRGQQQQQQQQQHHQLLPSQGVQQGHYPS
ncbi:hypothetical protein QQS21_003744 [Conoideocrella luteorostrata]|uniref:Cyclin n=1 Tax=Conoideocrella luteorostrata TaxID=1105319 RepID=A0AAJ0CVB2_9HYPO|nr:hypothetical protein QQS21_003744 [Conoideocrella luteorostrata]